MFPSCHNQYGFGDKDEDTAEEPLACWQEQN